MENTPDILEEKIQEIERIGALMNAPSWLIEELKHFKRVYELGFRAPVGGELKHFTTYVVLHKNPFSSGDFPFKGGTRFHPGVTLPLLKMLAIEMTEKSALAGLPLGGAKAGMAIDPSVYEENVLRTIVDKRTEELLKAKIIDPYYYSPGPDVGTNAKTMYWMYNKIAESNLMLTHGVNAAACVSGKPIEHGGIPGREYSTAYGLLLQLRKFIELSGIKLSAKPTMAIQGFGNVGGNVALFAPKSQFGFKVVAVSDKDGGLYNPRGLDTGKLKAWHESKKTLKGFPGTENITNEELLALKVDILVPAALENQIHKDNAHRVLAKIVYEGGNQTVHADAYPILDSRKVSVIPGIAANVGGVIVSFLEWRINLSDRTHEVDREEQEKWVLKELEKIMHKIIVKIVAKSEERKISFVDSAHVLAMEAVWKRFKEKHSY